MCLQIKNVETIKIVLKANKKVYALPDNAILKNARIRGIVAYYNYTGAQTTPEGDTLTDEQTFNSAYLTLSNTTQQTIVEQLPLLAVTAYFNGNIRSQITEFDIKGLSLDKSQIELGDVAGAVNDTVIVLSFIYE